MSQNPSSTASGMPRSFFDPVSPEMFARGSHFPVIERIEDAAPALEGDSIKAFEQDGIIVLRYTALLPDTFATPLDIECRGLVFERCTGRLLSRPFHKFFNLGEREGLGDLDFTRGARLDEKLDGTMVAAFRLGGRLEMHTRGGRSRQADAALEFAGPGHVELCNEAIDAGMTPIFEWTGPRNRIVIPYASDALTLLALRDLRTGHYDDAFLQELAARHGVEVAGSLMARVDGPGALEAFFENLSERTDIEGGVLIFPDGHRVKLKTAPYLRRHKILANLANERYAYQAWLDGAVDDTAAAIGGERGRMIHGFVARLDSRIEELGTEIGETCADLVSADRKTAASAIRSRLPAAKQPIAFALLGDGEIRSSVATLIARRVASAGKRAELKAALGLPDWVPDIMSFD